MSVIAGLSLVRKGPVRPRCPSDHSRAALSIRAGGQPCALRCQARPSVTAPPTVRSIPRKRPSRPSAPPGRLSMISAASTSDIAPPAISQPQPCAGRRCHASATRSAPITVKNSATSAVSVTSPASGLSTSDAAKRTSTTPSAPVNQRSPAVLVPSRTAKTSCIAPAIRNAAPATASAASEAANGLRNARKPPISITTPSRASPFQPMPGVSLSSWSVISVSLVEAMKSSCFNQLAAHLSGALPSLEVRITQAAFNTPRQPRPPRSMLSLNTTQEPAMPAPENRLKSALARGDTRVGCWAGFAASYPTEVLAEAGFDWLVIDAEHAPNDLGTISAQLAVLRGSGAALARASRFSGIADYIRTANAQTCLLVQVETRTGLDALDEILAVEGVDGVFIGPSDLAADMGHLGDASVPEVQEAIRDALGRIAAAGRAPGILALDPEAASRYRDWGARFLAVGIDVVLLAEAARALAARWRNG